jgi:hypothetical protein
MNQVLKTIRIQNKKMTEELETLKPLNEQLFNMLMHTVSILKEN